MEGSSRTGYFTQDSLAAEMLNKLQNGTGLTTVAVPEGFSLQSSNIGSATLLPGSTAGLNSSLIAPVQQAPSSGDSVILNTAGGLDPTLTQFIMAAQSGATGVNHSSSNTLLPNVPSLVAPNNMSASLSSSSAQLLHPVLSATLAPLPSQNLNAEMVIPAEASQPSAPQLLSADAMTITVHCTMSDTVIVVGQQNWQCCMCREMCGFDTSIDQHLALRHNIHVRSIASEESVVISKNKSGTTGPVQNEGKVFVDDKIHTSCEEPLQTISEQALASLQSTSTGSSRTGLEREVALLMAQTFTHSGNMDLVNGETKNKVEDLPSVEPDSAPQVVEAIPSADASLTDSASTGYAGQVASYCEGEDGAVYGKMINKVERAILSTVDSDAKNDLLLVATELARMQKDLTSKRRQMKRSHRYIPCPECGKEVRNRKDLIKQHNRCHEKTKKFRCRICNKMFKYTHTLRRHVLQQGHKGGMPEDVEGLPSLDLDPREVSVSVSEVDMSLEKLVKTEVEDGGNEVEGVIDVNLTSLTSEAVAISPDDPDKSCGKPAYKKILATLLSKGEQNRTTSGKKLSLLQCFVCDREIRNRNYYISRHARCHLEALCYSCHVCGKEFYRSDFYKDHMMKHDATPLQDNSSYDSKGEEDVSQRKFSHLDLGKRKASALKPSTVPCKICSKSIFNRTYNIKRHARQHSITEWESILNISPSSKTQTGPTTSAQHTVHCGVCGMSFRSYMLKRRHMLKHRSTFSCGLCAVRFDSGAELVAHRQVCRKSCDTADDSICSDQGQQGSIGSGRGSSWRKHLQDDESGGKKWTCPVCHASIIHTTQSITRHMRELHSDGKPHNCPKCNRTYSSFHKMQRHLKSHGDTGGICDVCGKVFQTKAALRGHTKLHGSPEGMFQCPKCPTSFRFQDRLEKHMRKHDQHTDVCQHCGKVYISKIHLQRHISVVHLGVKDYRYKCDQCGAQFFESVQLRDHIAYRHKGIQLYTCKYCHKGFNCRPTMVRHERKEHTNYLPYKCKHCSQGFPEKSKLIAHEMTHTGVSPHKCDICAKYFTTGSALKAHKNLHLGFKPYECSDCGKTYLKNWHLQQHLRKAHSSVEGMTYDVIPTQNQQGHSVIHSDDVTQSQGAPLGLSQPQAVSQGMMMQSQSVTQAQSIAQPPMDQKSLLAAIKQPCVPNADVGFPSPPVPGACHPVPTADITAGIIQQVNNLQSATQSAVHGHGTMAVQPAVVYQ